MTRWYGCSDRSEILAAGVAFFGEHLAWPEAIGAGLTVFGLDLVIRRRPVDRAGI